MGASHKGLGFKTTGSEGGGVGGGGGGGGALAEGSGPGGAKCGRDSPSLDGAGGNSALAGAGGISVFAGAGGISVLRGSSFGSALTVSTGGSALACGLGRRLSNLAASSAGSTRTGVTHAGLGGSGGDLGSSTGGADSRASLGSVRSGAGLPGLVRDLRSRTASAGRGASDPRYSMMTPPPRSTSGPRERGRSAGGASAWLEAAAPPGGGMTFREMKSQWQCEHLGAESSTSPPQLGQRLIMVTSSWAVPQSGSHSTNFGFPADSCLGRLLPAALLGEPEEEGKVGREDQPAEGQGRGRLSRDREGGAAGEG